MREETFDGSKSSHVTKVNFHAGFASTTSLRSMAFIGLDMSSSPSFPAIPDTLIELHIENCMLTELPMTQILRLKHLETLTIRRNIISQDESKIASLSAAQFEFLQTRSSERTAESGSIRGTTPIVSCPDGHQSQWLNGVVVCVGGNVAELERRLQTSSSSTTSKNATAASSNSTSSNSTSSSSDDDDSFMSQSIYVLVSLAAPALYFLYKVGLYLYFYATYSKDQRNVQVIIPQTMKGSKDNEERRTTENESSRSVEPPESIVLPPPPPADQRRFNNMSFWVDEELQDWRMDFNQ
uniref:Uncharacterized protein n=1 Tax=Globisporangium ultimum (strain ATCC 200006 / CBS 805.95 / DAOM BR144) TaxID=431595 RepID=K3X9G0_GLOUD